MLLNLPPNPLPISMPPPLLSSQKKERKKKNMATRGEDPVHLHPNQTIGFCRCTEAKRWANQSSLEHEDIGLRTCMPSASGRSSRWVGSGACGWINEGVRDPDSATTAALSTAVHKCSGNHPLTFP